MIVPKDGIQVEFIVPGIPKGFTTLARHGNKVADSARERVQRYYNYCDKVRVFAKQARLKLPLQNGKELFLMVDTFAFFKGNRHPDPENVRKGIVDAMCYGGDDKFVGGYHIPPFYDDDNPHVEVVVEWWDPARLAKEFEVYGGK
jgi:Holliday junction resolvase RusA-like endonuclease